MKFFTKYKKILKQVTAIFFVLLLSGCEGLDDWSDLEIGDLFENNNKKVSAEFIRYSEPGNSSAPVVEFILDPKNTVSVFYNYQIKKSCDYAKIPFRAVNLDTWNSTLRIGKDTRVLCLMETKKLSNASILKLIDFVSGGGTLFIPFAQEDHRMSYLYGFKPQAEWDTDSKSSGWHFTTPFLPTLKGSTTYPDVKFFGFAAQNFSSKIKIFATAGNNANYPAIVENPIGKGRVLLYNTSTYFAKIDRGFLFAGVLKGIEGIPYPIANTSTIFLDDFPCPLYDIKAEPVASELNLMMSDYVKQVWWPDMLKLAKTYNIKYSAMICFDYKNKITPPFVFDQWNSKKITTQNRVEPMPDWLVRDVAKNKHELAFHGYNHVSITKALWKNQEFVGTALNAVKKKWDISNFGDLPTSYVPPSNVIDKDGVKLLKKDMPSLKYMCSLYLGVAEDGGNREFDYDPYNKDFFDYPRVVSGFYMTDEEKYCLHSTYLFTGIWTHFVHPDDIFQIPSSDTKSAGDFELRNLKSYGWYKTKGKNTAMLPEFRNYLSKMTTAYPQLRFVDANDGGNIVMQWRASRYAHSKRRGLYTVRQLNEDSDSKQYWFMYGSPKNAARIEAQLKSQTVIYSKTPIMDGYLYSAYTNKPKLTSIDLNYETPAQKANQRRVESAVRADYLKFQEDIKKFKSGAFEIEAAEYKFKLEMALLKDRMLTEKNIDSTVWNKYAKFMNWEDKGAEVWKMLDAHVKKYPTDKNIMYSKELDRLIGYSDEVEQEKWMSAQLQVTPYDKELLTSYIANFSTDENWKKIEVALKSLYSVEPSPENYKNYIRHLLQYDPEAARAELADKNPSKDLGDLTTNIVWLFADNEQIEKAYEWSAFSAEIDFVTKMNWLIELKKYDVLEKEYRKYIADNPDDYKAKALMADVFHEQGRFKEAWILANSLPESPEKEELRKPFNIDVVFENPDLQEYLIENEAKLFYPNVLKSLIKEHRLTRGNFIDTESSLETNQKNNALFKNRGSFNFFDKKGNLHSVGATYSKYYEQKLSKDYADNVDNELIGAEYSFKKAEVENKINYWTRGRAEIDKSSQLYYQFGAGANYSKNKRYSSVEFNLFPAETAPAVNQKIYQLKLNLYQDFYLFKIISTTVSLEGNYYTKGLLSRDTIFIDEPVIPINPEERLERRTFEPLGTNAYTITDDDDALEGSATVKMSLDNGEEKRSRFIPFLESQYSRGSEDLSVGYPYWMIKERFYGGGGLGWKLKLVNFETKLEASYFFDDYSSNFQRYSGNISYQLFDYTALTANFEFFSQDKYYSNSFQFGIKYNLKKRVKRK